MRTYFLKLIGCFLVMQTISSCNFAAGSYPYAEKYIIHSDEASLIQAIKDFKDQNPKFVPPLQTQLTDGRNFEGEHWYHVYFYIPETNELLNTWIRPEGNDKTTFAFVAVNKGLILGNWKDINDDFDESENYEHKRIFEEKFLNTIKSQLKTNKLP